MKGNCLKLYRTINLIIEVMRNAQKWPRNKNDTKQGDMKWPKCCLEQQISY